MKIKTIIILVVLIIGTTAVGCSNESNNLDEYYDYYSDAVVESVKTGTNSNYPDTTYGEAFDNFFTNTSWKYFDGRVLYGSESEKDIVRFTGNCSYGDEEVEATIEFTVYDDSFEVASLSFDGEPQGMDVLTILIQTIFNNA